MYTLERVRQSFKDVVEAMADYDNTTHFTSEWFIAECLKIAAEFIDTLERGPLGFRMSNDLYLKPSRNRDGKYEVSIKKFDGNVLQPYPIAQAANDYGAHEFAKLLCDSLDKLANDYTAIVKKDTYITDAMKIRFRSEMNKKIEPQSAGSH